METWGRVIAISLGGVAGVNARYWLGVWMNRWAPSHWATFVINISGSFAIGFSAMLLARWLPQPNIRLMVLTGFIGGYTTFSTLAFESVTLWERGERVTAIANMAGSLVIGFVAALLGIVLARDVLIATIDRHAAAVGPSRETDVSSPPENRRLAGQDAGSPDLDLPPDAKVLGLVDAAGDGAKRA